MEFLGRLFGKSRKPDQQPQPRVGRPPVERSSAESNRPTVDRNFVSDALRRYKEKLLQPPTGDRAESEQLVRDESRQSQDVTPELLDELNQMEDVWESRRKYVREGERIIFNSDAANHAYMAIYQNMEIPDDAGFIGKDRDSGKLILGGSSASLSITNRNKNRLITIDLLRKIDPSIEIDEGRIG